MIKHRRMSLPIVRIMSRAFIASSAIAVLVIEADAQEPAFEAFDNDTFEIQLDPITVRGREGDEGSATVFTREEIENQRLYTLEEVLRATPGVNVYSSGGTNVSSIYIRGVGSMYPMNLDDSAATVTFNGSPLNARHISLSTLDAESIEILRGPQGTRSGASALAGIVNIVTIKPTQMLQGYARGEYGEERQRLLEGAVGGPITDTLSGRVAVRYAASDSWVTNVQDWEPIAEPNDVSLRGSLRWEGDNTEALLTYVHQTLKHFPVLFILQPYGDKPHVDQTPGLYDDVNKVLNRGAFQLTHDFGAAFVNSSTSYVDAENTEMLVYGRDLYQALFGFPGEFWAQEEGTERVFFQDLSISSPDDAPFDWRFGAMFESGDGSYDTPRNSFGSSSAVFRDFDTTEYALYGETTFSATSDLLITAGLRQSWVDTKYSAEFTGLGVADNRSLDESFTSGRFNVSYDIAPTTQLHATYARGFMPGGLNIYAAQPAAGLVSALATGWVIGRCRRRSALLGTIAILVAAVSAVMAMVHGLGGDFGLGLATALFFIAYNPAATVMATLMMDRATPASPATDYTLQFSLYQFAAIGTMSLSAVLSARIGIEGALWVAAVATVGVLLIATGYPDRSSRTVSSGTGFVKR